MVSHYVVRIKKGIQLINYLKCFIILKKSPTPFWKILERHLAYSDPHEIDHRQLHHAAHPPDLPVAALPQDHAEAAGAMPRDRGGQHGLSVEHDAPRGQPLQLRIRGALARGDEVLLVHRLGQQRVGHPTALRQHEQAARVQVESPCADEPRKVRGGVEPRRGSGYGCVGWGELGFCSDETDGGGLERLGLGRNHARGLIEENGGLGSEIGAALRGERDGSARNGGEDGRGRPGDGLLVEKDPAIFDHQICFQARADLEMRHHLVQTGRKRGKGFRGLGIKCSRNKRKRRN